MEINFIFLAKKFQKKILSQPKTKNLKLKKIDILRMFIFLLNELNVTK